MRYCAVQSTLYNVRNAIVCGEGTNVPVHRSGTSDPARTLHLLWRDASAVSTRGPKQGLTVEAIVQVATTIADSDGIEAVTMRRLAQTLGIAPMSIYTYVPGKAELLDLMLDAAYAAMRRRDTSGWPWRQRLTAIAEENLELFQAHPWAATISPSRPPLGPGLMTKYEHELSALDGLGLSDVEMDASLTYVLAFVQGWARTAAEARSTQVESGIDDQQWWEVNAPLLAQILDNDAYPTAARVGSAAGAAQRGAYNPAHAFDFGWARVLDGLAAVIDERT
jgi:AcrR family transcriptional regulator